MSAAYVCVLLRHTNTNTNARGTPTNNRWCLCDVPTRLNMLCALLCAELQHGVAAYWRTGAFDATRNRIKLKFKERLLVDAVRRRAALNIYDYERSAAAAALLPFCGITALVALQS